MSHHFHATLCRLMCGALLLGSAPAMAQGSERQPDQAPRIEVNLTGLDLATPEGVDLARRRIGNAARAVCSPVNDLDGLHLERSACVHLAREQANRQLGALHDMLLAQRARPGRTVDYALKTR